MHFDIFTLFPECFTSPLECSILKRAIDRGLISVALHDLRSYATDRHHVCDDYPFGGGAGMVMKPEPVFAAVETVLGMGEENPNAPCPIILLSPQGRKFQQSAAWELSKHSRLALICGHYEGVDERIREHLVTEEISVGDYVLTGGEIPALVLVDAVTRLLPGSLGDETSVASDSFSASLLEHPHYTRPAVFRGWEVPEVLRSGNHAAIDRWRLKESMRRTLLRRPELLSEADLGERERELLREIKVEG